MKKRELGLSQKKKAVGLHTAFSFAPVSRI